jgi:hypothetical protein
MLLLAAGLSGQARSMSCTERCCLLDELQGWTVGGHAKMLDVPVYG